MTALALELTPGVNMTWLALLSAAEGRRAGLAAVAGIAIGLSLLGLVAGVGASTLLTGHSWVLAVLRGAGIAYLLWMAWDAWPRGDGGVPVRAGVAAGFRRGLLMNMLNAKSALVFVTLLPGFVHGAAAVRSQLAALTIAYVVIATTVHLGIVALAGGAHALLADARRVRRVRTLFALALVVLAIMLALRRG
ncbi:LysE family translocator [Sphingobium sp. OAS761]|uniref:LysE family translocator n=1 Tax=Sphingobium sp. OAS761 TaxID=2817901 RepID=UPI0020A171A0|nr:LysE family transporter [Sphingobium sp. OAS761]